jgi:transcriptional regulator with XRE-family HTH domain
MARRKEAQAVECGRRLGVNLLEFRGRSGFSQQATAERAGLHRTEVSLIEGGKRVPRLDTIVKLAGAVGVEPCELLRGMTWELNAAREESK